MTPNVTTLNKAGRLSEPLHWIVLNVSHLNVWLVCSVVSTITIVTLRKTLLRQHIKDNYVVLDLLFECFKYSMKTFNSLCVIILFIMSNTCIVYIHSN